MDTILWLQPAAIIAWIQYQWLQPAAIIAWIQYYGYNLLQ